MDNANTNKQLRIYDETGKFIRVSVDEAIANKYNYWKDWKCSAGIRGLYIDYDGNIWICNSASSNHKQKLYEYHKIKYETVMPTISKEKKAEKIKELKEEFETFKKTYRKAIPFTSENMINYKGFLGNIYDGFNLNNEWVNCPWSTCSCGADVILSKAKTDSNKDLLEVTKRSYEGQQCSAKNLSQNISEHKAMEMNFPIPYQILWDLGRKCNYDCSYCWPGVHNRTDKHKPLDVLIGTADKIIQDWADNNSIRWLFGGGEPTLHPYFVDFLKYLKGHNQWTGVTSNGTRSAKYWAETIQYLNSVNLSAHFDGLHGEKEENKFIENCNVICDHFDSHNDDHWLEIKIMSPPKYFNRALNLKNKILNNTSISKLGANNRIKGFVSMVPIRDINDGARLVQYTDDQINILRNQ